MVKAETVVRLYTSVTKGCVCFCLCVSFWCVSECEISLCDIWMKRVIHWPDTNSQYNIKPYNNTVVPLLLPRCFPHSSIFFFFLLIPPSSLPPPVLQALYSSLTSSPGFVTPGLHVCVRVCVCGWSLQTQHFLQRWGRMRLDPWPLDPER